MAGFGEGELRFINMLFDKFIIHKRYITCYKLSLTCNNSIEALEHAHKSVIELKRNVYECIEEFIYIADTDIQNLRYEKPTNELISLSIEHQNLICYFIDFFDYRTYDNDPIADDCINITNDDFYNLRMKYYYNIRRLREDGLVNTRPTLQTSFNKRHYPVNNLKRPIKCNLDLPKFDTMTPFFK